MGPLGGLGEAGETAQDEVGDLLHGAFNGRSESLGIAAGENELCRYPDVLVQAAMQTLR